MYIVGTTSMSTIRDYVGVDITEMLEIRKVIQ